MAFRLAAVSFYERLSDVNICGREQTANLVLANLTSALPCTMGPDEMEEIMASVLEMMGDDPETRQAIQDVMVDIRSTDSLSSEAMKNSLQSIM
jgi:hypothetical protein